MGVREVTRLVSVSAVVGHLRDGPALLVVDNCEHLIEAVGRFVSSLMQACPELTIVATSREPLRCEGEAVMTIAPLSLPRRTSSVADLLRSEAVQLFLDRAATGAAFTIDEASAPLDVAAVCERLDGLPLALELAAGMLRAASPGQGSQRGCTGRCKCCAAVRALGQSATNRSRQPSIGATSFLTQRNAAHSNGWACSLAARHLKRPKRCWTLESWPRQAHGYSPYATRIGDRRVCGAGPHQPADRTAPSHHRRHDSRTT